MSRKPARAAALMLPFAAALGVSGCSAVSAGASVAGTVVSTAASVAGTAVSTAASVAGTAVRTVTP